MPKNVFDNQSVISSLKGADRVRKRPAVIFGSDGLEGCEHSFFEILSNSIDESREGFGKVINVTFRLDRSITVEDFGRGVPLDWNEKEKRYNWELVYCELYAGGKYNNSASAVYEYSLGTNGLGACATQCASEFMDVTAYTGGTKYSIHFRKGEPVSKLEKEACPPKKTGTVTTGQPEITDLLPADGVSEDELLRFAAALESKSEHPLSRAILNGFAFRGSECPEAENFAAVPGRGLTAKIEGYTVCGGNADFIREKTALPESITQRAAALADKGKTPLYFSRNNELLGVIAVADVMKSDAAEAIRELKGMGLRVVMLTGDNARTAAAIGSAAGVDAVVAGVLPDGKEAVIRKLRESGKVAMVGDGINDAPALTRADVGLAVGAGTDVAIDAADVVLMKSGVSDVSAAIRLSRAALRNIRENLFWAFIYNIIGIPLAAGVWIPIFGWTLQPMFGALAMSLSSFCVVTNALRLNLFRLHEAKHDKHRQPVTLPDEFTAAPQETNTATDHKEEKTMYKTTVTVEGMMCHMCEKHVNEALSKAFAAENPVSDHTANKTEFISAEKPDEAKVKEVIEAAGYTVKAVHTETV